MKLTKLIIYLWVYLVPIPFSVGGYYAWVFLFNNTSFAFFVTTLPILYGYLVPGIATNVLKKWQFKGRGVIGSYYIHHGFMYCANMSCPLLLSFIDLSKESLCTATVIRILLTTAGLQAFVLWIHDILLVKHDMVEIRNRPGRNNKSPEEIVTHYAPLCFFLLGITYAAAAVIAFYTFVVQENVTLAANVRVWLWGLLFLLTLPGIAYQITENR